ncbi:MAG: DNA polymerase III subunit delta' [Azoarcus sp.]|nr:DNA polymerase III subunit delta' [Azoarcus sp.]
MMHAWLDPLWRRLLALGERLPHALLITGMPGLGQRDLAEAWAARLLCEAPAPDGQACGHCRSCLWRRAGNHPDLRRLTPESEEERTDAGDESLADERPADGEAGGREGKAKKSTQIVIGQVRAVQDALTVTAHRGGRRAVIVDPAEAMNAITANALLKLLEEPPEGCVFLLVSSAPRKLLPTLRSRCQQWNVPRPDAGLLRRWREGQGGGHVSDGLLALCGGMPLAAQRLAEQGAEALLERFTRDLGADGIDPLRLAAQWEAWLKKDKAALAAGFGVVTLVDWMQRWVSDLAVLRLGGRVRYFPAQAECLAALSARMSVAAASNCYNEFLNIRKVAAHPLNLRLFVEDMLMRYARMIKGGRS